MSTLRVNTIQNTSGVEVFTAKAWVNFDGTGTASANQTVRASGNVSSVFKNGTGDYTVNFTSAMADANYAVTLGYANTTGSSTANYGFGVRAPTSNGVGQTSLTTTSVRVTLRSSAGNANDADHLTVAIFR